MTDKRDEDVIEEGNRIQSQLSAEVNLQTKCNQKLGSFPAVNNLTLGAPYGECFGLLSVNGVGKTTFKILTGVTGTSHGNVFMEVTTKWFSRGYWKIRVRCRNYSEGMKRRLSTAMRLIGDPPLVMLDEPTSGVDPVARRQFWGVIHSNSDLGQAIVLKTHNMDKIDALCSGLAIMVNGQFQCFGGVQHLSVNLVMDLFWRSN
ncbi:unnamed protein product [Allacma fusca]|uniref:ABC transporter domain-containing protein n=1 Tax=Allacma fusca TaxID=39272 RepID=A0A8J2NZQ8_9HEXA|nr:unnamed protein product [Allacma fusca]